MADNVTASSDVITPATIEAAPLETVTADATVTDSVADATVVAADVSETSASRANTIII